MMLLMWKVRCYDRTEEPRSRRIWPRVSEDPVSVMATTPRARIHVAFQRRSLQRQILQVNVQSAPWPIGRRPH